MNILVISLFDEWCLGLRSISAALKARGHEVSLVYLRGMNEIGDGAGEGDPEGFHVPPGSVSGRDLAALDELARRLSPGLIGISLTSNYPALAAKITTRLREITGAPVVWGGVDPTANPDLAIESVDIVCVGEGEGAISELADRLAVGEDFGDVRNLWARQGETIHRNPVRPLIQDLDALPWQDFEPGGKFYIHDGEAKEGAWPEGSVLRTHYPTLSGRGCPFSCSYCCNSMLRDLYGAKGYVRLRSVQDVLDEVEHVLLARPEIDYIEFHDDVFGIRQDWLEEFAEAYPKRIGLPFFCLIHPSACSPERIGLLKRAGIDLAQLGIQSGSRRMLREVYRRKGSREQIIQAARWLQEAGVKVVVDLIGANPLEREEDYRETLDLMLELPKGFILHDINDLAIYRNYPIAEMAEKAGRLNPWIPGRHVTGADDEPAFRFWKAVLSLTQFPEMDSQAIRLLADDPLARERPEMVEAIFHALRDAIYLPGTRERRRDHEQQLAGELARLRGSRAVRWYLRLKQWLR